MVDDEVTIVKTSHTPSTATSDSEENDTQKVLNYKQQLEKQMKENKQLQDTFKDIRPKKYICVFQVSRPYLRLWPHPKHFIALKGQEKKERKKEEEEEENALCSQNIRFDFVLAARFLFSVS